MSRKLNGTKNDGAGFVVKDDEIDVTEPAIPSSLISCGSYRLYIALLLCMCYASQQLMRGSMTFAIVCMVNATWLNLQSQSIDNELTNQSSILISSNQSITPHSEFQCEMQKEEQMAYEGFLFWTIEEQSLLFSGLIWTALPTALLGGYGAKRLLLLSTSLHIVACLLHPYVAVQCPFYATVLLRLVIGMGMGMCSPCISALISGWYPNTEKSSVVAMYTVGTQIGCILVNPMGALFCQLKHIMDGWPLIFYVTSSIGVVFCVLWSVFSSNLPSDNRFVSNSERQYLQSVTPHYQNKLNQKDQYRKPCTPWLSMLKSTALWACLLCHVGFSCLAVTIASYLPTFFRMALKLNMSTNGLLSATPFICQFVMKLTFSFTSDRLKKKTNWSHTTICRSFNTFASYGAAVCLLVVSYVRCDQSALTVLCMCLAYCCFGACIPGFMTSLVCIAPAFSGTVGGISRSFGLIGGLIGPFVVGNVVKQGSVSEWRIVFIGISVWLVFSGTVFAFFGSAVEQPWAVVNRLGPISDNSNTEIEKQIIVEEQILLPPKSINEPSDAETSVNN